ncbi:Membrane-bound lytic murein transglycosylase A precursor [Aggregatibacter actinomycetemcomitans]|uniref:murein transglycosylase A n=1 Tax=Aggregatibacter actinomycetemcomitans TaxID=714 RepID=UPI0001B9F2E5|nr:murein transglycosylase A [Aggregatibacter actinomycetemcomitans]ACX83268.1 murein transglycosylase [Aggregatibacter actinomycetemcomitans D11S-1]KOE58837.1 murein transglycosylase [Aggregatibacter actinomycetemcomitans serotype c str. SCC2302]KOE58984.1 murein transglycosylase [Aggregatibacter actinomycetemcomitans serotype c str. AAS4A]KOE61423.1 murein transglycosylase [Aggregatibacter actinomycetemcomitans serotype c str. D17P-2]KYK74415.1 murein transglycosylase [Aggregatibacter actino
MLFNRTSFYKFLTLSAIAVLTACSSNSNKPAAGQTTAQNTLDIDPQKFGAIYNGRTYQQSIFMPVSQIENKSAVVNQGDFLTQLSNINNYSAKLSSSFAPLYNKVTAWVLAGANTGELTNFGIQSQVMKGFDGYQNVLMTGYYSPVIHARRTQQGKFNQPIYALPSKKRFSRAEIYAGALRGKGLELAYSDSMIDNFLLGVQGSGYVDFGEGNLNYFAYAGQNGYQYAAVGRLLVEDGEIPKEKMSIQAIRDWANANPSRVQSLLERNPSYVFFKNDPYGKVKGAVGVPLVPMASVASDRGVIPLGSVLLVEVPQIDNDGNWTGQHQLHLMVALDVGGAVNGHHFDLYRGIGDQAGHIAGLSKHYGRVWVLR